MHLVKLRYAGDYLQVQKCTYRRYGAPGQKRKKRMSQTCEYNQKYNDRLRAENLQLKILLNFENGYHLILKYDKDKRPESYKEADENLKRFLDRIRRKYKKENKIFKYIAITERGKKREALHHHMIIECIPEIIEDVADNWGKHFEIIKMYDEGNYKDLAEYFVKIETKEEATKGKARYHISRNLKKPLEKISLQAGSFKKDPVIPEGFILVPETLFNGHNEQFGIKYQKYLLKRSDKESKILRSERKRAKKCTFWESIKNLKNIFRRKGSG